jgi:hypothetical protein
MNEQDRLDELLDDAATHWRVPSEIPREAMWEAIAPQLAAPRPTPRRWTPHGWGLLGAAIAASLLLGVALGRQTAGGRLPPAIERPAVAASSAAAPYRRTTEELLGQTAVLLVGLPEQHGAVLGNEALVHQGLELLQTTRLLLDSPVASDPRMHALLEDLELVLVQVAGLEPRTREDLSLIRDAVSQRDLVPRLRSAVVSLATHTN